MVRCGARLAAGIITLIVATGRSVAKATGVLRAAYLIVYLPAPRYGLSTIGGPLCLCSRWGGASSMSGAWNRIGLRPFPPGTTSWQTLMIIRSSDGRAPLLGSGPWGNPYVVNVGGVRSGSNEPVAVGVQSAGPNGIVETHHDRLTSEAVVGGGDIGVRID